MQIPRINSMSDNFVFINELVERIKKTKSIYLIDIHEAWITNDIESLEKGLQVKDTKE